MPAITKAHMVEPLLAKNIHTKGESAQVIETLLEIIKQTLEQCGEVLVSGFGRKILLPLGRSTVPSNSSGAILRR